MTSRTPSLRRTTRRTDRVPGLARRGAASLAALALTAGALSACSPTSAADSASGVWDSSSVHAVTIDVDEDAVTTMLETYTETGEKEWLTADVTIDGQTISDAGIRLKGNSSLRGVSLDADPSELPWLIDLDQFVDGQDLEGWEAFVIRSNTTETSLNEAVALTLLDETGLASEDAVAIAFSANDSDTTLRLMVQDLDNTWDDDNFSGEGTLYKAESGGDYSYRGDDAESYDDVFDIEAGTDDFEPLTEFLKWLEESSDDELADGLADRLDVEAFATYLAFEDLIDNFDDIEGPGNNSFLRYDEETGLMTVVAWDHNLAFGATNGGGEGGGPSGGPGGPGGGAPGGERPAPGELPEGAAPPEGAGGIDGPGGIGGNVLAERFREVPAFVELYDAAVERLQAELFDDGTAQDVLDAWTAVLTEQADDLVDEATVAAEAAQIEAYFDGRAVENAGEMP